MHIHIGVDDICAHASRLPTGIYTQRVKKKMEKNILKKITAGTKTNAYY